jgi:hypothetical protein
MNHQTWRTLQEHGVTLASELRLEFVYRAPDPAAAVKLQQLLEEQTAYDVSVQSSGASSLPQWIVAGTTGPTSISPDIVDQWVDWMIAAGLECDCDFDGWGTEG